MSVEDLRPHLELKDHRTIDDRIFKGGGASGYTRNNYNEHANHILKQAKTLKKIFEDVKNKDVSRRYFRLEIPEDHNIWNSEGKKIQEDLMSTIVGTPKQNVVHLSTLFDSFDSLIRQLETYGKSKDHTGKTKFSIIDSVEKIPASEKISIGLKKLIDSNTYQGEALLTLFDDLPRSELPAISNEIKSYLQANGGDILSEGYSNSGKLIRIKAKKDSIKQLAEVFIYIQSVDSVDDILTDSSVRGERIEDSVIVSPNNSSAKVCIFDSGVVKNSRFISGSIIAHEEPFGPPHEPTHGTFVASRIIFGNSLRDDVSKGHLYPDVKVLSVCMLGHDGIGNRREIKPEEFVKVIRDTVERWYKEIKVYNISMNFINKHCPTATIIKDAEVSILAAEIDYLIKKYNVIFVLTTGNYTPANGKPYPLYFADEECRLFYPGESVFGLTVGAVSDRENQGSMTVKNSPAPFTRRGPGFNQFRKPDLVAEGGNLTANGKDFADLSVAGIGGDGCSLSYGSGTSYAAPLVSRSAAKLFESFPDIRAELVKALLLHSCSIKPLNTSSIDNEIITKLVGNGISQQPMLLNSDRWNQNYIYQGIIGYRKILRLPIYIPQALTLRKGRRKLKISYTLVFFPETSRVLKEGYCKAHLRVNLSKRDATGNLKPISNDKSQNVINDKYCSIVRGEKEFSSGVSHGDWEISIELLSRWMLKEQELSFALVLTISDPKMENNIDIYNAISNETQNRFQDFVAVREQQRV